MAEDLQQRIVDAFTTAWPDLANDPGYVDHLAAVAMTVQNEELERLRDKVKRKTLAYNAATAMEGVHKHRAARLRTEPEHARAALAGNDEAIQSFMADCARTAERQRERAGSCQREAERAEGTLNRIWELAERWKSQRPVDETDWELQDPTQGHRSAAQEILAIAAEGQQ